MLYEKLGIKDLAGLQKACADGRIAALKGFGQATAENIVLHKTLHVPVHHSRTAKLKIPITQDQADGFQNSPDYFEGKACRVHATVVDTYGLPPYESE